jgi:oligopeptide transport system substrate-binding protein
MEGLMRRSGNKIIPGIASRYEVSKDGLTYKFYLRDAVWTDGKPVKAQDFAYAWQRALSPDTASEYAFILYCIKNGEKYNYGKAAASQLGIKVINDKTLQVTLESPTAYFIDLVTYAAYMPARKDIVEKYKDNYFNGAGYFVTNGPYKLTEWIKDDHIKIEKNPAYWNAKQVKIDVINARMYAMSSSYKQDYLDGNLDVLNITPGDEKGIPQNEIKNSYNGVVWYIQFNNADKAGILTNANIRKALTLSINRQQFINDSKIISATPALSLVAPEIIPGKSKSFREEAGNLLKDNDVKTAQAALSLGLKQLKLTKLPVLTFIVNDNEQSIKKAQILAQMWKKNLGIDVKIENAEFRDRMESIYSGDYQMTIAGWGPDYHDAYTYLEIFSLNAGFNNFGYKNTEFTNMITSIRKEVDSSKRIDLLKKAEKKIIDDYVVAPLYFPYNKIASKPYLKNAQSSFWASTLDVGFAELIPGEKVFATTNSKFTMKTDTYWYKDVNNELGITDADLVIMDSIGEAAAAVIVADSVVNDAGLELLYNECTEGLKDIFTNAKFTDKVKTKISGFSAIKFKLTYTEGRLQNVVYYTLINTPDGTYTIMQWSYSAAAGEQRKPEFDKMIQSIKLLK